MKKIDLFGVSMGARRQMGGKRSKKISKMDVKSKKTI